MWGGRDSLYNDLGFRVGSPKVEGGNFRLILHLRQGLSVGGCPLSHQAANREVSQFQPSRVVGLICYLGATVMSVSLSRALGRGFFPAW